MYLNPLDRPRYCWRCRVRVGLGPGTQVCGNCQAYNSVHGLEKQLHAPPDMPERIAYYRARADQGLDLFTDSPWRKRNARPPVS